MIAPLIAFHSVEQLLRLTRAAMTTISWEQHELIIWSSIAILLIIHSPLSMQRRPFSAVDKKSQPESHLVDSWQYVRQYPSRWPAEAVWRRPSGGCSSACQLRQAGRSGCSWDESTGRRRGVASTSPLGLRRSTRQFQVGLPFKQVRLTRRLMWLLLQMSLIHMETRSPRFIYMTQPSLHHWKL